MSEIQILLIHSDKKEGLMVFEDITKRFAILSVIPFVGMFLSIALFPLLASWIKKTGTVQAMSLKILNLKEH